MVPGTWRNGNSLMMSHGGTEAQINFGLCDFTDIEGIQYRNIFIGCSMNKTINILTYICIYIFCILYVTSKIFLNIIYLYHILVYIPYKLFIFAVCIYHRCFTFIYVIYFQ